MLKWIGAILVPSRCWDQLGILSTLFFYITAFIILRIRSCNTTPLDPWGAWRDPKIDKHRQNPQDTCSNNPERVFSEGAEPPEAGHHPSHSSGGITTSGDLGTGQKCELLVEIVGIFKKCRLSQIPQFENWNVRICLGTVSAYPKVQISKSPGNPGYYSYSNNYSTY